MELATFLIHQPHRLDVSGCTFRVLLKKHRRLNPTRIPLQDGRPIFEEGHYLRANLQIVRKQIELRQLLVRPVDAIETGDGYPLAFDVENQVAFRFLEREKFLGRDCRSLFLPRDLYHLSPSSLNKTS